MNILRTESARINDAGADDDTIAPDDPRLEIFRQLLRAIKVGDARAGIACSKRLRKYNISVCLLPARGQGGRG